MTLRSFGWVTIGVSLLMAAMLLPALRVPLLVAVVVIVPGFLVALAVFPDRLAGAEGLLMTLLASFGVVLLAGLVMSLLGMEISASAWWLFLVPVCAIAAVVALYRRRSVGAGVPLQVPRPREVAYVAAGLVLISFSLNVAAVGARDARTAANESLAQLWIVPGADGEDYRVGVENLGSLPGIYRVEVQVNESPFEARRITVEGGETWLRIISPSGLVDRVDVYVYPDGGTIPIRHVWHLPGEQLT